MLSSRGEFWDYLRKLASSRLWFWFQSVPEGYFNFFQQKRPLPVRVFENCFNILNKISRVFFTGTFQFSRKEFPKIFTYTQICFHACDFKDIFTETFMFSRTFLKIFFHGDLRTFTDRNLKTLTHKNIFFTGKKLIRTGYLSPPTIGILSMRVGVFSELPWYFIGMRAGVFWALPWYHIWYHRSWLSPSG